MSHSLHTKNYLHIIEKLQEELKEMTAKFHKAATNEIEERRAKIRVESALRSTEKTLKACIKDGWKMQEERDNLKAQLEQQDEMISKAFDLATKQTQRATDLKKK